MGIMSFDRYWLPLSLVLTTGFACVEPEGEIPVTEEPNEPPGPALVTIGPEAPRTTEELRAAIVTHAEDPDRNFSGIYHYRWSRDFVAVPELDGSDTVPAALTRRFEAWSVEVRAEDDRGELGPASGASTSIVNSRPEVDVVILPELPTSDDDLTASVTVEDPDEDSVTTTFAWFLDGERVLELEDREVVPASATAPTQRWEVHVLASDTREETTAVADSVIVNRAPAMVSVQITPDPAFSDDTLTAAGVGEDADGDPVTLSHSWTVSGSLVPGVDGPTLGPEHFERGDAVVVEATPHDGREAGPALASSDVEIINSPPTVLSTSIRTATPVPQFWAQTLGWVDVDGDQEAYLYAWSVDGVTIGTDPTLDYSLLTLGQTVLVEVTPTDGLEAGLPVTDSALFSPALSLTPTTHDFGDLDIGCVSTATFDAENTGTIQVNVSSTTLTGDPGLALSSSVPSILAGGATGSASVQFGPTTPGPISSVLAVESNALLSESLTATVTGGSHWGPTIVDSVSANDLVDILFIVDDSPNATGEQALLGAAAADFLTALQASGTADWRIGVVAAAAPTLVADLITPTTTNPDADLAAALAVGNTGGGLQLLGTAYDSVTPPDVNSTNMGLIRDGADLRVIVLALWDDATAGPATGWADSLRLRKDHPSRVRVSSIDGGPAGCSSVNGVAGAAPRLAEVVEATGGLGGDVCATSYSALMTDLGDWADPGGVTSTIPLTATPWEPSIVVEQNATEVSLWTLVNGDVELDPSVVVASGDILEATYSESAASCVSNDAPTVVLTAPANATTCQSVVLDGTGSNDPDGILSWNWSVQQLPAGSVFTEAMIDTSTPGQAEVSPDVDGLWEFGLRVEDVLGAASETQTVTLPVSVGGGGANIPPIADAGPDFVTTFDETCTTNSYGTTTCTCVAETLVLDAGNSSDPDGNWLLHEWAVVSGTATLSSTEGAIVGLDAFTMTGTGPLSETVQVDLTVTDCNGAEATDTLTITYDCQ